MAGVANQAAAVDKSMLTAFREYERFRRDISPLIGAAKRDILRLG
jgi:hypothetical protein